MIQGIPISNVAPRGIPTCSCSSRAPSIAGAAGAAVAPDPVAAAVASRAAEAEVRSVIVSADDFLFNDPLTVDAELDETTLACFSCKLLPPPPPPAGPLFFRFTVPEPVPAPVEVELEVVAETPEEAVVIVVAALPVLESLPGVLLFPPAPAPPGVFLTGVLLTDDTTEEVFVVPTDLTDAPDPDTVLFAIPPPLPLPRPPTGLFDSFLSTGDTAGLFVPFPGPVIVLLPPTVEGGLTLVGILGEEDPIVTFVLILLALTLLALTFDTVEAADNLLILPPPPPTELLGGISDLAVSKAVDPPPSLVVPVPVSDNVEAADVGLEPGTRKVDGPGVVVTVLFLNVIVDP